MAGIRIDFRFFTSTRLRVMVAGDWLVGDHCSKLSVLVKLKVQSCRVRTHKTGWLLASGTAHAPQIHINWTTTTTILLLSLETRYVRVRHHQVNRNHKPKQRVHKWMHSCGCTLDSIMIMFCVAVWKRERMR